MKARFSGHQFSGKPRFKGHSSENMGNRFLIYSTEVRSKKAENPDLADKTWVTDFPLNRYFTVLKAK